MQTLTGIVAILMWGFLALLSAYTRNIPPFLLLGMCFFVAFLLLLVSRAVRGESLFAPPVLTLGQWIASVVGLFGFHFCYFMAIRFAPAVEVSLIGYLWPLLLGMYVAPKSLRGAALSGGLIGFLGAALLVSDGNDLNVSANYQWGYLLALMCAFIWSGYSWFLSRAPTQVDDIGWVALASAILAVCAHLLFESTAWPGGVTEAVAVVLLGLGPVGGAFYLWDVGMKHGNRQLLASLSFCTPVISTLVLWSFGFAQVSVVIVTSVGLILLGAALTNGSLHRLRDSFIQRNQR